MLDDTCIREISNNSIRIKYIIIIIIALWT